MKKMKRTVAMAMALAMAFSANVFASSDLGEQKDQGGTVKGTDNTIVKPIYSLVLPTKYTFQVDPFERTTTLTYNGSGINTGYGYPIINKSNVDVKVSMHLAVAISDAAVMVAPADLVQDDATNTTPEFFMYAVPFKSQTGITVSDFAGFSKATYATAPDSMVLLTTGASSLVGTSTASAYADWATLEYRLKSAVYEADQSTFKSYDIANGVGGFTLYGKLNPQVTWAAGDLKLLTVYNITGITPAVYTATTLKTDGLNLCGAKHAANVVEEGFLPQPVIDGDATDTTLSATSAGTYTFADAFALGQQVIAVKVTTTKDGTDKVVFNGKPAAPYTWTPATATVKGKLTVASTAFATLSAADSYTIEVQFTNGTWMDVTE